MSELPEGVERLFRAARGEHDLAECEACRAGLPTFVEAEAEGEDAARVYPAVAAHLDVCEACGEEYAALLDIALAEAAGLPGAPGAAPPLVLPRPLRLRRWAHNVASAALDALQRGREELDGAAQAFFDALDGERLAVAERSTAFGLGPADSDALPLTMAAYYALLDLTERHGPALRALAEAGQLRPELERAAGEEARRAGLRGPAAEAFVSSFVDAASANEAEFLDLTADPSS